ncbi:hypothetical protein [Klebsiella quasipneumoniae]|uniref:hypothetical protein n=1 Tax=Klebsiella quasipneumoniae TaxID=1463165 RepID=UPI001910E282|nr:hypothetical protein [Klebsiella quasipneumoniae]
MSFTKNGGPRFSRTVAMTTSDSVLMLPNAEYSYESETKDKAAVGELAESIAEKYARIPKSW